MKRKPGYYWVLQTYMREWEVAQWNGENWFFIKDTDAYFDDSNIAYVGGQVQPDYEPHQEKEGQNIKFANLVFDLNAAVKYYNEDSSTDEIFTQKLISAKQSFDEYIKSLL